MKIPAQSKLAKNTLKLTGGSLINYIIPIITTPILTRIYLPEDYGDWGVFSSLTTILAVFVCGGYEYAIVEEADKKRKDLILRTCALIALLFNVVLLSVIGILSLCNVDLFGIPNIIFLVPLYLFVTGLLSVYQNYSNAKGRYKGLAVSQIIAGLSLAGIRIVLGLLNIENGLVYGAIASSIVTILYLMKDCKSRTDEVDSKLDKFSFFEIIKEYKNYPLFDAPSTFIIYLSNNIPVLLLVNYFDKALLGGYAMVLQLLLLPMSFIGSNMGRVFFQQISSNRESITRTSQQVYKFSFLMGFAVIFFFVCGGDYLLYRILGKDWEMAGEYALYLSLWSFFTISYAPIKPIYRVLGKQSVQMKLMMVSFVVQTIFLFVAANYFSSIGPVIMLYSIVCSIFKIIEGKILLGMCNNAKYMYNPLNLILSIIIVIAWITRSLFRLNII